MSKLGLFVPVYVLLLLGAAPHRPPLTLERMETRARLGVGETLVVLLREHPAARTSWALLRTDRGIKVQGEPLRRPRRGFLPGRPEIVEYRFVARRRGLHQIVFRKTQIVRRERVHTLYTIDVTIR